MITKDVGSMLKYENLYSSMQRTVRYQPPSCTIGYGCLMHHPNDQTKHTALTYREPNGRPIMHPEDADTCPGTCCSAYSLRASQGNTTRRLLLTGQYVPPVSSVTYALAVPGHRLASRASRSVEYSTFHLDITLTIHLSSSFVIPLLSLQALHTLIRGNDPIG